MRLTRFYSISLFLLALSFMSLNQASASTENTQGDGACMECMNSSHSNQHQLVAFISAVQDQLTMEKSCQNFSHDQQVGPWGKFVLSELRSGNFPAMSAPDTVTDLEQICPRYPTMAQIERDHLWLLIINSMTYFESSCEPKSNLTQRQGAPDGTAFGLLQLNEGNEDLYVLKRTRTHILHTTRAEAKVSKFTPGCYKNDSHNPETSLVCGMTMLEQQLEKKPHSLFDCSSYWKVLKPNACTSHLPHFSLTANDRVIEAVNSYIPCNHDLEY